MKSPIGCRDQNDLKLPRLFSFQLMFARQSLDSLLVNRLALASQHAMDFDAEHLPPLVWMIS